MYNLTRIQAAKLLAELQAQTIKHNECLIWFRAADKDGYPQVQRRPYQIRIHRLACYVRQGPSPHADSRACNSCYNPMCINEYHVAWGDAKSNTNDMIERERVKGLIRRKRLKLTLTDYQYIQTSTRPLSELAIAYRCSYKTIQKIRRGERGLG
jgi:hypothetical protein